MSLNLHFDGLACPVHIEMPEAVRPLLDPVFRRWPRREAAAPHAKGSFATLGPWIDGQKWRLAAPRAETPEAFHDPVDAICDLIVEMSWERLRSRSDLLCLHAAAVQFGERLVLFPNARRAGKSLLSANLARLGHPVFTDDFIPLKSDDETRVISGVANGIAPRLRLPLPETLAPAHSQWIHDHITTRNTRYGYLTEIDLPPSGSELPVGAIVLLDREGADDGPPTLSKVSPDEAMAAVVKQNFGRHVHAGAILTITQAIAETVPILRLRYSDVDAAAQLLSGSPHLQHLPKAQVIREGRPSLSQLAPLGLAAPVAPDPMDMQTPLARVPGFTAVETEKAIYLASARGMTIQRLNPVSIIIWKLLEEPFSGDDLVSVLIDIFPDVPLSQLTQDAARALRFMIKDGLIALQ